MFGLSHGFHDTGPLLHHIRSEQLIMVGIRHSYCHDDFSLVIFTFKKKAAKSFSLAGRCPLIPRGWIPGSQKITHVFLPAVLFCCSLCGRHLVASSPVAAQLQCPFSSCVSAGPSGLCGPDVVHRILWKGRGKLRPSVNFLFFRKAVSNKNIATGEVFWFAFNFIDKSLIYSVVFQVYSKVIQLYQYVYSFFFRFSHCIGYYMILSRVLEFLLLYSGSLLIFYFICSVESVSHSVMSDFLWPHGL